MNEEKKVIKVGHLGNATQRTDGKWTVRDEETGSAQIVSNDEFMNHWVSYECLPANVTNWLESVLLQNMPLTTALGADELTDNYDYSLLTDSVINWLIEPQHQLAFAQAMLIGPRVKVSDLQTLNVQLSLF